VSLAGSSLDACNLAAVQGSHVDALFLQARLQLPTCYMLVSCLLPAAVQVSLLGDAPVSSGQPSHLMGWKEVSRRTLLQRTGQS
jgi:hypothetical protein